MNGDLAHHFDIVTSLYRDLCDAALPLPEDVLDKLAAVLGDVVPSPEYEDHFRLVHERMAQFLAAEVDTGEIFQTYPNMPMAEQLNWLQKQVNQQAEFQSLCGIEIQPALIEPCHLGKDGDIARVGFDPNYDGPEPQNIFLNMDFDEIRRCPIRAMDTVTHEGWHHFNNQLGRAVKFGRLQPGGKFFDEGLYFKTQWERNAFIKITPPYERQMDERLARAFGAAMRFEMEKIRVSLASPGFILPLSKGAPQHV